MYFERTWRRMRSVTIIGYLERHLNTTVFKGCQDVLLNFFLVHASHSHKIRTSWKGLEIEAFSILRWRRIMLESMVKDKLSLFPTIWYILLPYSALFSLGKLMSDFLFVRMGWLGTRSLGYNFQADKKIKKNIIVHWEALRPRTCTFNFQHIQKKVYWPLVEPPLLGDQLLFYFSSSFDFP